MSEVLTHYTKSNLFFKVILFGTVFRNSNKLNPSNITVEYPATNQTIIYTKVDLTKCVVNLTSYWGTIYISSNEAEKKIGVLKINHPAVAIDGYQLFDILIIGK